MSIEDSSPPTKPEIGLALERARTERNLSLRQVEEATKIRARYLNDLERENFDVLPAVYVLGSLKTYADYLGLDGEALVLELKSRRVSPHEERDQTDEEPANGGGLLASLAAVLGLGDRGAAVGDEDDAKATVPEHGSRLYWGLGAALSLVLTVAFVSGFGGGDQRAVSQVREPEIPEAPSRIALSGDLQVESLGPKEDTGSANDRPEKQTTPPDEGSGRDERAAGRAREEESGLQAHIDAILAEGTDDVAVAVPASASTSASSTASATSTPVATASTSAATVPPATESTTAPATTVPDTEAPDVVAPDTETPDTAADTAAPDIAAPDTEAREVADPGVAPATAEAEPGTVQTASAATGAPDASGSGRASGEGLDASRLSEDIFGEVESATGFVR